MSGSDRTDDRLAGRLVPVDPHQPLGYRRDQRNLRKRLSNKGRGICAEMVINASDSDDQLSADIAE
jgi:hypothetical protein